MQVEYIGYVTPYGEYHHYCIIRYYVPYSQHTIWSFSKLKKIGEPLFCLLSFFFFLSYFSLARKVILPFQMHVLYVHNKSPRPISRPCYCTVDVYCIHPVEQLALTVKYLSVKIRNTVVTWTILSKWLFNYEVMKWKKKGHERYIIWNEKLIISHITKGAV